MAILAEEIVEEWLNRQGYFTIRGIKLGVDEIDLLAVKRRTNDSVECRHIEVQASIRPVSYISQVPKAAQRQGRAANSVKRTEDELVAGVDEWVHKKFFSDKKLNIKQSLWNGEWSSELVLNVVKSEDEVKLIQRRGIAVIWLKDVVSSLTGLNHMIGSAAGGDFIDLIQMGALASSGK